MPTSFQVRASLVEVPLLSTSTNDRCGFRVERLPPPSPLSLSPTPLLRHGVGPLPLRLRQQTLFAFPFPLSHRHLRFTSVSMRSNSNAPRNLRLLFRLVRTGICTASSGRRTAAGRHHPPTRKKTDERTVISPWHSLHLSPRAVMLSASIFLPTPNVSVAMAFDRSLRQPFASPVIADSEHRWSRFRFSPLRLTTATAFGARDCSLRLAYAYPILRHGVGRSGFTCTRKLSLTAPLLSAVNPKPPLAFPSRRCRDAALTSSISHGCHTNRHILPTPYRKKPPTFHAPGSFHYPSAKLTPPQAPMGGAPPDCFTSAMSATASLTPSYLRLRARAGRLTVCGASSSTESLSLRCATRHLPFALIPM